MANENAVENALTDEESAYLTLAIIKAFSEGDQETAEKLAAMAANPQEVKEALASVGQGTQNQQPTAGPGRAPEAEPEINMGPGHQIKSIGPRVKPSPFRRRR